MKQAAKDNEPSGGCVSTYIAHELQNTLIIILLITPLSQYIPKKSKVPSVNVLKVKNTCKFLRFYYYFNSRFQTLVTWKI